MQFFDQIIASVSKRTFFREYWTRQELYSKKAVNPVDFFSLSEFTRLLYINSNHLSSALVRLIEKGKVVAESKYTKSAVQRRVSPTKIVDLKKLESLCTKGCTLSFTGLNWFSENLFKVCNSLSKELKERVQVNGYLSQRGVQGFDPHYDHHEIVIMQIEGEKQWTIYGTPEMFPLPTDQFYYQGKPNLRDARRYTLKPGDTLYLPRGLWHEAKAAKSSSLHLTFNINCKLASDLIIWIIQELIQNKVDYRKNLNSLSLSNKMNILTQVSKDIATIANDYVEMVKLFHSEQENYSEFTLPFKKKNYEYTKKEAVSKKQTR